MTHELDISTRLARHVATTSELPRTTMHSAKRALLDGLGVTLAASGLSEEVQPFIAIARGNAGDARASILGSWERVPPAAAAFANGAMAHALDFEDSFDAAPTHPNAALIPAALALAQSRNVSGAELLIAIAVGCDLTCRVALAVGDALEQGPWYPPTVLGSLGAVAAAANLLRLNERQVKDAFSLMLCQTACSAQIKHSKDSVIRAVRESFPAQAAVNAALLALSGVRGFEQPLEGKAGFFRMFANDRYESEPLFARLGEHFYIEDLSFKPWPCCRGTHPYIEAAQQLRTQHGVEWQRIETIRADIGPVQRMLSEPIERKRAPSTAIDAKFSIPFTLAIAFIAAEVTLDSFAGESLRDLNVLELARRVTFENREHASATSGSIEVVLKDGQRYTSEIPQALGHPTRPLDDARLQAKFIDCAMRAAHPMSRAEAQALCDRVMGLDETRDVDAALCLPPQ